MSQMNNRLGKLRKKLTETETEAILISQPENRHYLSGFSGSSGLLLITRREAILATDFRYLEQAKRQAPDFDLFPTKGDLENWFPALIGEIALKKLGFEAEYVSFDLHRHLNETLNSSNSQLRLVPTKGLVENLRATKEPEETELISKAVAISDAAMEYVASITKAGMTEREVAWELEKFMREQGSQPLPFDVIVASGPNAALPHAQPSERAIQPGETIVIDIGARMQGYASDLSRTICLGKPDDTFKKVYDVVLKAQLAAITGTNNGMTGKQADSLAREVIEQAGYGDNFGHGLGHGVGLATHERPYLNQTSRDNLTDGMVFTIEPGIYLPGWGGVRTEDTAVMEDGKIRVLSQARK